MNALVPPTCGPTELAIVVDPHDNVATALGALASRMAITAMGATDPVPVILREPVALCHKFAIRPIACGEVVVKYGQSIGYATQQIAPGEHVHTHNLRSAYALQAATPRSKT